MKKTTKAEKLAKGTYSVTRDTKVVMKTVTTLNNLPPIPAHLSPEAAQIFTATCKTLQAAGRLARDITGLVSDYAYYSNEATRWQQRCIEIDKEMGASFAPDLMRKFNLFQRLSRQNSSQAAKIAKLLCILPADRPLEPGENPMAEFML